VDRFTALGPVENGFVPPPARPAPAYDDPGHPEVRATLTARGLAYGEAELEQVGPRERLPGGGAELRFRCPPGELDWYADRTQEFLPGRNTGRGARRASRYHESPAA
jgi:hypothetical protein